MKRSFALILTLLLATALTGRAAENQVHSAPEVNPPSFTRTNSVTLPKAKATLAVGPTLYSIGQPTDDEQLHLELINRARANPPAEGQWLAALTDPNVVNALNYFHVDLGVMITEFNAIAAAPPLAFNSKLMGTARVHSQLMFDQRTQAHVLPGEPDVDERIVDAGYNFQNLGENIFVASKSALYGHAAFQVDWGQTNINFPGEVTFGMQNPRGHRNTIHNPAFREVGVGIYYGSFGVNIGPQAVTQDFGTQQNDAELGGKPLLTGVVYNDFDGDLFYDLGEGLGGVTVEVTGNQYYAVTASSGGYTIPLPGNGNYTVTFTAANGGSYTTNITVAGNANFKVDWRPVYQMPTLTGPTRPVNGFNMTYSFSTPVGITSYAWQAIALTPLTFTDNADGGLNNFNATITGGYSATGADSVGNRASVFHLANPGAGEQILEYKTKFVPKPGASLSFLSRLALATTDQIPRVQISQDNGVSWQTVWSQTSGGNQSAQYTSVNIDLGGLARVETKLRFNYSFFSGSYYGDTGFNYGWCIDSIQISGADTASVAGSGTVNNTSQFLFTASVSGDYLVSLKPSVAGRNYPAANVLTVQSVAAPTVTISAVQNSPSKKFDVGLSHAASGQVKVWTATSVAGPWMEETGTSLQTLTAEQSFRVTLPTFTGHRFYRVQLTPQ
ncbi:MAG TPA: carboxypeptidase regulatory-like domain-containing protein [Verrucomicrobiae bacterium]